MANVFDQFDVQQPTQGGNPFDQFDIKSNATPVNLSVSQQAQQDVANKVPFWQGAANAVGIPALRAGLTRLPLGIMQAESEGLSSAANAAGLPDTASRLQNTANLMSQEATSESANAEANKSANPVVGTIANVVPQIGQVAGYGASLPGIIAAGFTSGAAAPKLSPDQQSQIQPANTIADQAMNALGYLPKVAVTAASNAVGIDPNSRFAQGVQGGLTGAEGYGIAKTIPKIADALTPEAKGATQAQVADLAKAAYAKADAEGGQLHPNLVDQTIAKAEAVAPQTPEGKAFAGQNETTKAVNDLQALKGKPLSLAAYEEIDKDLTNRISKETDITGNVTPDGKNLIEIRQHLRDATTSAGKSDLVNGAGFDSYNQARQLASTGFRMRDVQAIFDKAASADVPQTVIKNGFAKLKSRGQGGFTDAEWTDVGKAARTGIVAGTLKTLGSKLMSGIAGAAAGAAGGGFIGAPVGLAVGEAIGYPLRKAGQAIQAAPGKALMNKLGNRPVVQQALSAADLAQMPAQQAAQVMNMRNRVNTANNLPNTLPDQLALPKPETVIQGNVPAYDTNAMAATRQGLNNIGMTGDVVKVQRINQVNQAWEQRLAQPDKAAQLNQLAQESAPTLQDMVQQAVQTEADRAAAVGERPQVTPLIDALDKALKQKGIK